MPSSGVTHVIRVLEGREGDRERKKEEWKIHWSKVLKI